MRKLKIIFYLITINIVVSAQIITTDDIELEIVKADSFGEFADFKYKLNNQSLEIDGWDLKRILNSFLTNVNVINEDGNIYYDYAEPAKLYLDFNETLAGPRSYFKINATNLSNLSTEEFENSIETELLKALNISKSIFDIPVYEYNFDFSILHNNDNLIELNENEEECKCNILPNGLIRLSNANEDCIKKYIESVFQVVIIQSKAASISRTPLDNHVYENIEIDPNSFESVLSDFKSIHGLKFENKNKTFPAISYSNKN